VSDSTGGTARMPVADSADALVQQWIQWERVRAAAGAEAPVWTWRQAAVAGELLEHRVDAVVNLRARTRAMLDDPASALNRSTLVCESSTAETVFIVLFAISLALLVIFLALLIFYAVKYRQMRRQTEGSTASTGSTYGGGGRFVKRS
jgi:hypothetical protein